MPPPLSEEDLDLVAETPVFADLDRTTLALLLRDARIRNVCRGELLFTQGDEVTAFFVVLDGWMKIFRLTPSGEEAVVGVFTRGQSFAEAAAFTGGVYPASCEAATDGRLLRVSSNNLLEHIRNSPEVGLAMLASTSRHLHMLVHQIEQLKAHTGAQRVAEFLASLCPVEEGPCTIGLPYDKVLIAGRLGMKPESLSRAFARLKPLGVTIRQNHAAIADVARLVQFAGEDTSNVRARAG